MTENKRFYVDKSPITHLYVPYDKEHKFVFEGVENGSTIMKLVGLLNNALEENEQLKHELHSISGLYAFDKMGDGVKASNDVICVPRKDLIKLDYGDVE